MKPTGVVTNGIGQRTTAHLNLTVPFRWSEWKPSPDEASTLRVMRRTRRLAGRITREGKIAPAGYDRMERA